MATAPATPDPNHFATEFFRILSSMQPPPAPASATTTTNAPAAPTMGGLFTTPSGETAAWTEAGPTPIGAASTQVPPPRTSETDSFAALV